MERTAYVDYQTRAHDFKVGDKVVPAGMDMTHAGRVVEVWAAIGMVEVEYPSGSRRVPVEALQRLSDTSPVEPPLTENVPGGSGGVDVSSGPPVEKPTLGKEAADRVAARYVKSLYWKSVGRKYQPTKAEQASGKYSCPRCSTTMKKAIYKRQEGQSFRLFACPACHFLLKDTDIIGCAPINPETGQESPLPASKSILLKLVRGK